MKNLVASLALALSLISLPVHAQSSSRKQTIAQLEHALGMAYMNKELGKLDARRPLFGKVKIVIEHSLAGDTDKDRFEIRSFTTLARGEQWLNSREGEDGTPFREARDLLRCRKGVCTYNLDGGISHNHLYLKKSFTATETGVPSSRRYTYSMVIENSTCSFSS